MALFGYSGKGGRAKSPKADRSKWYTLAGMSVFGLVVMLPPVIHGYIYPNGSDDSAVMVLRVLDTLKEGQPIQSSFAVAYKIVGLPIVWLSNNLGSTVDNVFLWFYYVALFAMGLTIYFVMSKLVNRKAGWLAVVLALFCAQGLLFQFHWGQLFNAINMGIILPLLVYFSVRYLTEGGLRQLAVALALSALFGSFHLSGIYLPFVAGFLTAAYAVCQVVGRRRINLRYVLFGLGVSVLPAVVYSIVAWSEIGEMGAIVVENAWTGIGVSLQSYFMNIVSPTILVLLLVLAVLWKDELRRAVVEVKLLVGILAGAVVVLSFPTFTGLSLDAFRQGLDMATVLAMLVAVLVSILAQTGRSKNIALILVVVIGIGLFRSLPLWFDYTSAMRPADKDAVEYINTLDYDTYNCSPEVAYWIYDRYTKAKHTKNESGLMILRDTPMTPKSDIRNKWYVGHGIRVADGYALDNTFSDSKVVVEIYRRARR